MGKSGRAVGLRDLTLAKVLTNTTEKYEADEPKKIFKAVSGKVTVKRSSEKIYSDDELEDTESALDSIDVELTGDKLTMERIADIYGCRFVKGMLIDNQDDSPAELALGYRVRESNGKYRFVWLYCGKFDGDDEDEHETRGEKPSPKTKTIKGTFYARKKDGNFRVRVHESELLETHTEAKEVIKSWFSEVQEPLEEA